jgi:large repetitive protein
MSRKGGPFRTSVAVAVALSSILAVVAGTSLLTFERVGLGSEGSGAFAVAGSVPPLRDTEPIPTAAASPTDCHLLNHGTAEGGACSDPSSSGARVVPAADTSLTLTPNNGSFNAPVTANGSGFAPLTSITVSWNSTVSLCSVDSNGTGAFSCPFRVPTAPAGGHSVSATDGTNQSSTTFEVTPSVTLGVESVVVGQPLTAIGYGFGPSEVLNVTWDHGGTVCASTPTNTNGAVGCTFLVPASPGGENNVTFTQGSLEANRSLTVATMFAVSPPSGVVGTVVTLTGSGFAASVTYLACLETTLASCATGTSFTTGDNGSVPSGTTLTVPSEPPGSLYLVTSVDGTVVASANFIVTTATVTIAPTTGPVGTVVNLSGSGLAGGEAYYFCFQGSIAACPLTTGTEFTASADGTIPVGGAALSVPPGPAGSYYADVSTSTGLAGAAEFTLIANLTVNRTLAEVSTSILAEGTGFPESTSYTLSWNSTITLCGGSTNATGGFNCTFAIPLGPAGPRTVIALAGSDLASAELSVSPFATLAPTLGPVGSRIGVTGTGFSAQVAFSVVWNGTTICSGSTDSLGRLTCGFAVPAVPEGSYTVNVSEPGTTLSLRFAVTASLESSRLEGVVGSVDNLTGSGFAARTAYSVVWNGSAALCSGTTNPAGAWSCDFSVPTYAQGTYPVEATAGENTSSVDFTVVPNVVFFPAEGSPGEPVLAEGTGFAFGAVYAVSWNSSVGICGGATPAGGGSLCSLSLCTGTTPANGVFYCNFTVPATPAGVHPLVVTNAGADVGALFTLVPGFTVSASAGPVGEVVSVLGGGFDSDAAYTLAWGSGTTLCGGTTGSLGNLSCSFAVPTAPEGTHPLVMTEGSHSITASFTVTASLALFPTSAVPGATVTAEGEGFAAGEPYVVSWSATGTLCSGMTDRNGSFVCSFVVPSVAPGTYVITGAQGPAQPSVTFFVTSPTPSSSPPPSSTPFPWWLVVLVAVAAVIGALAVYRATRHRGEGRTDSAGPPGGPAGTSSRSPEASAAPPDAASLVVSPLSLNLSSDNDPEALFQRLVPRYSEILRQPNVPKTAPAKEPKKPEG